MASQEPALPPPPGEQSNFVDPPSLLDFGNVTVAVCTSTVTLFFLLRCYARLRYKKIWNLEDTLIFLSWAGTVAFMGILAASMPRAGGKHLWDTTKGEAEEFAYWFHVMTCEYAAAICMTKVAILWLYRRAFSSRKGSNFEIACYTMIGINVAYYTATLLAKIFQCTPMAKIFDSSIPGTCISIYQIMISDGIFNIITDFTILLMPAVTIYRLQMERWKQLIVLMIFTFGLCAPIFSIVGFYVRLKHGQEVDVSWNLPQIVYWGGAEITTGTICVCLPDLGLLFNSHARQSRNSRTTPLHTRDHSSQLGSGGDQNPKRSRHMSRHPTLVAADLAHVNPYLESDEEVGQQPAKKLSSDSSAYDATGMMPMELPLNAVHVRYDVQVQRQSPPPQEGMAWPVPSQHAQHHSRALVPPSSSRNDYAGRW